MPRCWFSSSLRCPRRSRLCSRRPRPRPRVLWPWRHWPCSCGRRAPASPRASSRVFGRPWPRAFLPQGPGSVLWRGLWSAPTRSDSAKPTRRAPVAGALLPALVMPLCLTLSPLECSEVSPSHAPKDLAFLNLENSSASKTRSAALMTSIPLRHRMESTLLRHLALEASSLTRASSRLLSSNFCLTAST